MSFYHGTTVTYIASRGVCFVLHNKKTTKSNSTKPTILFVQFYSVTFFC